MRIDGQTTAGSLVRYNKKTTDNNSSDKVRSTEAEKAEELQNIKNSVPRDLSLDDFLPKYTRIKSKTPTVDEEVGLSADAIIQSTGLSSQDIADKIKEVLAREYPDSQISFAPEDNTSEKISNNIIQGVTALFDTYAAQNKNMEGEELISSFMKVVRGGVEKGLSDAKDTLKALGALNGNSDIESGIEETMRLVEIGLKDFEDRYRKEKVATPVVDGIPAAEQVSNQEELVTISQ